MITIAASTFIKCSLVTPLSDILASSLLIAKLRHGLHIVHQYQTEPIQCLFLTSSPTTISARPLKTNV